MQAKPNRWAGVVVGLVALVLGACGGSGAAAREVQPATGSGPAVLQIGNASNEPFYYIYMSPSQQQTWGTNLLGSDVVYQGETFVISNIAPGYWDVRVEDSSGNYKEFYNQYFESGAAYALDVSADGWYRD
jgi:hypothetical protein